MQCFPKPDIVPRNNWVKSYTVYRIYRNLLEGFMGKCHIYHGFLKNEGKKYGRNADASVNHWKCTTPPSSWQKGHLARNNAFFSPKIIFLKNISSTTRLDDSAFASVRHGCPFYSLFTRHAVWNVIMRDVIKGNEDMKKWKRQWNTKIKEQRNKIGNKNKRNKKVMELYDKK